MFFISISCNFLWLTDHFCYNVIKLLYIGVDIVKPSTIYYNVQELSRMSVKKAGSSSSSPSRSVSEAIYEAEPTHDAVFTNDLDPKLVSQVCYEVISVLLGACVL